MLFFEIAIYILQAFLSFRDSESTSLKMFDNIINIIIPRIINFPIGTFYPTPFKVENVGLISFLLSILNFTIQLFFINLIKKHFFPARSLPL